MRKFNIILTLGAILAPAGLFAGWLPTGWGDFYYTNTVNWTDGVIDNVYDAAFSAKATQNLLFDAPFDFTNGLSFTHPGEITTVFRGQGGNVAVRLLGDIEINKSANGSKGSLTFGSNTDGQHLDIDLGGAKRTIHNANLDVYLRNTLFNGDLRILNGNWAYLSGAGGIPAGTLEVAPASTVVLDSSVSKDTGATRAASVRLTRSTLLARGNTGADSTETITGSIVVDGSEGGCSFISLNGGSGRTELLTATTLEREPWVPVSISGATLGAADGSGAVAWFKLGTAPGLIGGGGAAGSSNISIVPGMIGSKAYRGGGNGDYALTFLTYDSQTGFRPLELDTEFLQEDAFPVGQTTAANVRVAYGATVDVSSETTINSLLIQGRDAKGTNTYVNGTGPLHVTSGQVIIGYHRNSAPYVNVPLDFGSATGFIEYPQGKGSYMNGAISGTGGVVFYQASTATTGAGLTLGGGSSHTWTGDTYILSQLAADENALPGRGRLGDLYVRGMLEVDNGTYNGLNGCGIIRRRTSGGGTISFGDNNANGDFTGRFEQNKGKFTICKIGAGTQRLACSSMVGINGLQANEGTLILDGTLSESSVTVAADATFGGNGTIAVGGISFTEGAKFVVLGSDDVVSCMKASGSVIGGSVTINASVTGKKWRTAQCIIKCEGEGSSITAPFVRGEGIAALELRNNDTELWATPKTSAFCIVIR
ncbi:MAG: hypothetical protein IJG18_07790 [Kiritimatiellae bacterium]|nr:hypothetical protein [Kiritimatiellia bacterium]